MDKINFQNVPNTTTPVNATNLNAIQDNVDNAKEDKMISGTWTPTLTTLEGAAPTMTYTTRVGFYKKIGKLVYISFYIKGKITALTGTNNYGMISGLPFVVDSNVTLNQNLISVGQLYHIVQSTSNVNFLPYPNASYLRIQSDYGTNANKLIITDTDYFVIAGSGWYEIT